MATQHRNYHNTATKTITQKSAIQLSGKIFRDARVTCSSFGIVFIKFFDFYKALQCPHTAVLTPSHHSSSLSCLLKSFIPSYLSCFSYFQQLPIYLHRSHFVPLSLFLLWSFPFSLPSFLFLSPSFIVFLPSSIIVRCMQTHLSQDTLQLLVIRQLFIDAIMFWSSHLHEVPKDDWVCLKRLWLNLLERRKKHDNNERNTIISSFTPGQRTWRTFQQGCRRSTSCLFYR